MSRSRRSCSAGSGSTCASTGPRRTADCSAAPVAASSAEHLRARLARRPLTALGPELAATPLARKPYDLRHTASSLWLSAVLVFQRNSSPRCCRGGSGKETSGGRPPGLSQPVPRSSARAARSAPTWPEVAQLHSRQPRIRDVPPQDPGRTGSTIAAPRQRARVSVLRRVHAMQACRLRCRRCE